MEEAMSEMKYLSLDIIVKTIYLPEIRVKADRQKFLFEIKFDGVKFDIDGIRIGGNNAPQGRSIDFETSLDGLRNKLSSSPIQLKLYHGKKTVNNFVGEASYLWSNIRLGQIEITKSQPLPFFEQCEITKDGQLVGYLEIVFRLHQRFTKSRLGNRSLAEYVNIDQRKKDVEKNRELRCSNSPILKMDPIKIDADSNTEQLSDSGKGEVTQAVFHHFCDNDCDSDVSVNSIGSETSMCYRNLLNTESDGGSNIKQPTPGQFFIDTEIKMDEVKKDKVISPFPKNTTKLPLSKNHDNSNSDNTSFLNRTYCLNVNTASRTDQKNKTKDMNIVRRTAMSKRVDTVDRYNHPKNTETHSITMPKLSKVLIWLKEKYSPVTKKKLDASVYTRARFFNNEGIKQRKYLQTQTKNMKGYTNFIRKNAKPEQFKRPPTRTLEEFKKGLIKALRKSRRRYYYVKCRKSTPAFERHQHCLKREVFVPAKMGWRWDIAKPKAQKGWRPGCVKKSINEKIGYFLGERGSSENPKERLNFPKNSKTFKTNIAEYGNSIDLDIKRKQLKRYLKDMGFRRCDCGKPGAGCTCRSFMEKKRLEKAVNNLVEILEQHSLKDIVTLSDSTETENELHVGGVSANRLQKCRFRTKRNEDQVTQFIEQENSFPRSIHTRKRVLNTQRNSGFGPKHCRPKVQVISYLKNRASDEGKMESSFDFESDENEGNSNAKEILNEIKEKSGICVTLDPMKQKGRRRNKFVDRCRHPTDTMQNYRAFSEASNRQTEEFPTKPNKSKKNSLNRQCSPHQSPRVTKPISRWERIQQKRSSRPQWDDSIYIPPPLNTPASAKGTASNGQSTMLGSGHKSPKRCNDVSKNNERKNASEKLGADDVKPKPSVVQTATTKSIYHKDCLKAIKLVNDIDNTVPLGH